MSKYSEKFIEVHKTWVNMGYLIDIICNANVYISMTTTMDIITLKAFKNGSCVYSMTEKVNQEVVRM